VWPRRVRPREQRAPRTANAAVAQSQFESLTGQHDYTLAERTRSDLLAYYAQLPRGEGFGNGREARRTFETMVAEHANRLARSGTHTAEELTTLLPEDLPDEWTDRSAAMA
jgi:hypothetical protein